MANTVNFYFGTKQAFDSLINKDPYGLYFVDGLLYRGDQLYTKKYKQVTEYPIRGTDNITYVNTSDGSVKYWDNNEYHDMCKPIINKIDASSTNEQLASAKAIYDAIISNNSSLDNEVINNLITNRIGFTGGATVTDYIKASLNSLIDGAPETLNTFKELATAISDDNNLITGLTNLINGKADTSLVRLNSAPITEADLDYELSQKINIASKPSTDPDPIDTIPTDAHPLWIKTFDNVKSGDILEMTTDLNYQINKAIIQVYKSMTGQSDVIKSISNFTIEESESYNYDPEKIEFSNINNGQVKIKDSYDINVSKSGDYYVSDIISKADYIEINQLLIKEVD